METSKCLESVMTTRDDGVEMAPSFAGGYQIWFRNIYDDAHEKSGLASDFTDADGCYNTFKDALEDALNFSDEIYEEYEVIIEQYFSIWDEESEGYKSISIELLTVDATKKEKQLVLTDDALNLLNEQFPDED